MFAFIAHQPFTFVLLAAAALALTLAALGVRVIGEHEAGLVIKRLGHPLPPGRLIATGGEAGYQADLLPPGWHFPLWRWKYKVERVPLVTVPPGQIACVVANDGRPVPSEHVLGRDVPCDRFQDARAFLEGGGERDAECFKEALWRQILASGLGLDDLEEALIQHAVRESNGNLSGAARLLRITRPQLNYRLK